MKTFAVVTSAIIFDPTYAKVLMAQRCATVDVFPGLWSFPGGELDESAKLQDTLEENVRREVREEVGIEITTPLYFDSHFDGQEKLYLMFLCEIASGEPKPLEETQKVSWMTLDEALNLPFCPHVDLLLERVREVIV